MKSLRWKSRGLTLKPRANGTEWDVEVNTPDASGRFTVWTQVFDSSYWASLRSENSMFFGKGRTAAEAMEACDRAIESFLQLARVPAQVPVVPKGWAVDLVRWGSDDEPMYTWLCVSDDDEVCWKERSPESKAKEAQAHKAMAWAMENDCAPPHEVPTKILADSDGIYRAVIQ